jgi:hypothetical protein
MNANLNSLTSILIRQTLGRIHKLECGKRALGMG